MTIHSITSNQLHLHNNIPSFQDRYKDNPRTTLNMTESPKLLPFQCIISFDCDGGENHDPDGIMKKAKKVVEDGRGWVEVDFQFMPGFGYVTKQLR